MRWYKDSPEEGDYVVVTITDVDENSAYAELEEYEEQAGLIHISEVSRSWVQDLTKELGEGEKTVAQVIDADDDPVDLSIKRVNDKQKKDAMSRWNREKKAAKFLTDLSEILDRDREELYEEVIFPLQREFESSFTGFEIAVGEEEKLKDVLDDEVVEAIQEVAKENINLRQEKLEGELEVSFPQGDGVQRLKQVFENVPEGVEVKYVSAPTYSITAWGRNSRLAKKRMDDAVDTIREKVDAEGGDFEFSRA
ncbi:MAG: S1 RNA-binding domain-containing protein [Candidatus Nanohaloarchaea archaeon]